MGRLLPTLTATKLQATTYLLGIALFSISFLVFLNSSISFVVTRVIGQEHDVGDAVGTLGFADELLALVACPLWGLLSDRIGVRTVAVLGYCIVAVSLVCLVQSTNVYPELLLGRLAFSLGGAACSTMVTAVLPAMVAQRAKKDDKSNGSVSTANGHAARLREDERPSRSGSIGHGLSPSVSSELTITPTRYTSRSRSRHHGAELPDPLKDAAKHDHAGTSQLAGFVGMFTGAGALIALAVFLPLPTSFKEDGEVTAHSVQYSFYVVAAIALCVAIFIFFGLRKLPGEEGKSISALFRSAHNDGTKDAEANANTRALHAPSYLTLFTDSLKLGFTDPSIGLGYLGGFVARASSVGISLFIPLFVNAYFVRKGLCTSNPNDLTDIKEHCQRAYAVASSLSGIAETAALICAPLFGWLGGKVARGKSEWPLLLASVVGVVGYILFGMVKNPDAFHGGDRWAFLAAISVGISQIGAIVCSLALLGRGIHNSEGDGKNSDRPGTSGTIRPDESGPIEGAETAPLLPSSFARPQDEHRNRSHLKGSIAGMYSLAGGAGILLLTKLGGVLFDSWTPGAPFFMLAIFNALLVIAVLLVGGGSALRRERSNAQVNGAP